MSGLVAERRTNNKTNQIQVTATFYPLGEFAKQIGGNFVEVTTLTPPGVEPHDFEPTPQDLEKVYKSKVFIYNGAGFEPWVNRILPDLKTNGVIAVNASTGIDIKNNDPHVWLDPILAKIEMGNISQGLMNFIPTNAQKPLIQLDELNKEFEAGLKNCQIRQFVTSHQAFRYLAARYNLEEKEISGLTPDEEPSPKKMAELSSFIKDNKIKYIFFEKLVSPKLADTLAKETGSKTLVLDPIEGFDGKDYISVQRQNLLNLRQALICN